MNIVRRPTHKSFFLLVGVAVLIAGTAAAYMLWPSRFNPLPHIAATVTQPNKTESFPAIDDSTLNSHQQKIIALLRQEFQSQPKGTKYSGGVDEPWCADFVSWIMNEAGQPLQNPNSGSWRIPGTYTLRDYYESAGRFKSADSGYSPHVGDIMLYDNPSPFGQHTNIVIKNDNGIVTTIGGNEPGGIRVVTHDRADKAGFVGYGVLE